MAAQTNEMSRHRRGKLLRFVIVEGAAVGVLILCGFFAMIPRPADSDVALPANLLTIAAAIAVALIPILFFAIAPILPRGRV